MRHPAPALQMSDVQRAELEKIAKSQTAAFREVQRARALLNAAGGMANSHNAAALAITADTVRAWRKQFEQEGLARFARVRSGRGRKPTIPQIKIEEIVHLTQTEKPEGQARWTVRTMAERAGVSPAQVQRIWAARGLKPHLDQDPTRD